MSCADEVSCRNTSKFGRFTIFGLSYVFDCLVSDILPFKKFKSIVYF